MFNDVNPDGSKIEMDYSKYLPGLGTWVPPEGLKTAFSNDKGQINTGLMRRYVQDQALVTKLEDVSATTGAVETKPENYAAAFDPASDQYSVNTGNASVRQLESLAAVASTAPKQGVPEAINVSVPQLLALGASLFFIF